MESPQQLALKALQEKYSVSLSEATKILPPPELSEEMKAALKDIKELTKRPEELKIVLGHILQLEHETHLNFEGWKAKLVERLGWKDIMAKSVSRQLTELAKKHLIVEWRGDRNRPNKLIGYILDEKGLAVIGLHKTRKQEAEQKPPETPKPVDVALILESRSDVFMQLAEVGEKLKANRKQRVGLLEQIAVLDAEYEEIIQAFKLNPNFAGIVEGISNVG